MKWIISIIVIVIIFGILWVAFYNNLVRSRLWVVEAWSQIDVQLKRRNDLIPNLLEIVKGYVSHEQETLTKVTKLRKLISETNVENHEEKMELSNQLSSQLRTVFAISEAYPDLKANQNFLNLQKELSETEDKISYSRQLYNSSVTQYNIKRSTFPSNVVANIHHFLPEVVLDIPEIEKSAPEVHF